MVAQSAIDYCLASGDEVVSYTRKSLDISNRKKVLSVFKQDRPDAVLNCAAYTDVDGSETNIARCYAANTRGVENLALAAKAVDAGFVTISTDYVFDGAKDGFYTQRDTPNPQGIYAKAKFEGEFLARNAYARSIIVRTGWIYGKSGTNFLSVMNRLLVEGQPIKAISDSYGTPTFAKDLAERLRELAELDLPGVYHITNSGGGTSYADFARKVCDLKGFDRSLIEGVSYENLKRPAPRPVNSKLACLFSEKIGLSPMQNWEQALSEFLED
ncbi:dTDP-4-dehydrorhamnose reductase [soil metagenome]